MGDESGDLKELDPLFVDSDIYPNKQKMVKIDTSIAVATRLREFVEFFELEHIGFENMSEEEEKSANRFGMATLKEYINSMYQGSVVVLGDPTVKPFDFSYLADLENNLTGMFEVDKVVHTINRKVGFVTSITPNPISSVNAGYNIDQPEGTSANRDLEFLNWSKSKIGGVYSLFFASRMASDIVGTITKNNLMHFNLGYGISQVGKGIGTFGINRFKGFLSKSNNFMKWFAGFLDDSQGLFLQKDIVENSINFTKKYQTLQSYSKFKKMKVIKYLDEARDLARTAQKVDTKDVKLFKSILKYGFKYGDNVASILGGPVGVVIEMGIEYLVLSKIKEYFLNKRLIIKF
jgi:hypothetical protein